jgi:hypothetical protein
LVFLVVGVGCGGGGGGGTSQRTSSSQRRLLDGIVDSIDVGELGTDHYSGVSLFPGHRRHRSTRPRTTTIYWSNGAIDIHTIDIFDGFTTFLNVSY